MVHPRSEAVPSSLPRNRRRRILKRLALAFPVTLVVAYLLIGFFATITITRPQRYFLEGWTPAAFRLKYQDVSFPARGNDLVISAWYIPHEGSRQALVLVHGKDNNRVTEFDVHFVDFAASLHGRGFAVLMIDLRGHGRSGEAHVSWGINERRDIEGAVDWLKAQGFQSGSVGVLGVSLGAASSIFAAAEDPDIGALVEDSGYARLYPLMQQQWHKESGLPDIFLPITLRMTKLLYGRDDSAIRPVDEVPKIAPRPILVIQGTRDDAVPLSQARELQAASSSAEIWVVEGAEHGGAYSTDPQAYVERVAAFFERSLK